MSFKTYDYDTEFAKALKLVVENSGDFVSRGDVVRILTKASAKVIAPIDMLADDIMEYIEDKAR